MVTQKIVTRLSNDVLPPVRMVSGDVGREIQLEIYDSDESTTPIDLETYYASITIIKPDNTFVIKDFDNDKVELPEQAGAVTGHGYYQIKVYTSGERQIYTGQGPFIVDDDILSEEMIESVAEVNGYKFPDDFLTEADMREYVTKYELEDALAGIIDDDTTDYNSTWSSAKISDALSTTGTSYSTDERTIGKWVDGSDLKEKTYVYKGTGAANPFTTTIDFTGKSIIEVIPHYVKFTYGGGTVGYCAGSALVNNNSNLMNVAYDDNELPTVRVTCYIGSGTETYEVAFTIRYI